MVTIIKQGSTRERIKALLEAMRKNRKPKKGVDTFKYSGTLTLEMDPMEIQRQLRDEWE